VDRVTLTDAPADLVHRVLRDERLLLEWDRSDGDCDCRSAIA
jgi:hypothetical protein